MQLMELGPSRDSSPETTPLTVKMNRSQRFRGLSFWEPSALNRFFGHSRIVAPIALNDPATEYSTNDDD